MKRRCRLKHAFAGKSLAIILAAVLAIPVPGLERASVAYAAEMAEATTETPDDVSSGDATAEAADDVSSGDATAEAADDVSSGDAVPDTAADTDNDAPKPDTKSLELETAKAGAEAQASSADIQTWIDKLGLDGIEVADNKITLSKNKAISGSLSVTETLVLDLNGYELSGTAASSKDENMITVSGSLELAGTGSLSFSGGDNVINVAASGTLVNRGTDIHSENCNRGVFCAGKFELYGGRIAGNISSANGAGIVVHGASGHLDMSGGEISGNKTSGSGGGIRIQTGASADIHGSALITNNSADTAGGGIHVLNATCHIYENAVVSENSSPKGGGIYVEGTSTLNLSGACQIINNHEEQIEKTENAIINISETENDHVIIGNLELQKLIDETTAGERLVLSHDFLKQESVTIDKDITIDFNGCTIEGSEKNTDQLFFIKGSQVTFCGSGVLSQKNGPNNYYVTVNVQENSTFTVDGIEVSCGNCRGFLIENSTLDFKNGSMHDCGAANTAGGAIVAISGEINISGGHFYNNQSNQGAVIRALNKDQAESRIQINGGTFEKNQSGNGSHFAYGGAVYTEGDLKITGSPKFAENTAGFGGAVYVLGKAEIDGGEFDSNTAHQMGGAVHGQDITLKGSVNIHDNKACWGGGVMAGSIGPQGAATTYMDNPGNLYVREDVKISGNKAVDYSSYRAWGGGVWAYDLEMEGNVQIDGNTCVYRGGGIYSRHNLRITGGHITNNTGDIGGGIFLFNEGFIQGTPDNKVLIQGNQALDTATHQFAGGGIFVEHKVDQNSGVQGEYGANLQINGVVITDNTARGGGGIGGCGEAIVQAHSGTGMALYGNTSTGSNESARAQDLYLDGKGTLATQGIGHTNIDYTGLGRDTTSGPWQEMEIKQDEKYLEGMRFTATMSDRDKELANEIAGVIISGNTCASNGGGIGGNGAINIGMPVQTITARKVWDDFQDKYGARPQNLDLTLKHRGRQFVENVLTEVDEIIDTQSVTATDGWKYTWTDLPKLDDANQPWVYYVDEIAVPDYLKSISGTVITNAYMYRDFTVSKIWNDANDRDGIRPEGIEIQVLRNDILWDTVTLNASNEWKHVYPKVDRFDENGKEYKYSVKEASVPDGYTTRVNGFTVTNTHIPIEYTDFTARKIWDDANDKDHLRPETVVAILYRDTQELDRVTLNSENNWSHKFEHMPKTDGAGHTYTYTVKEETVADGYIPVINGYEITNRHIPKVESELKKTSFTVQKLWDDNDNANGVRPDMIEVVVYRNGIWFDSVLLSANNNWSHTYLDVDAEDASGTPYVYSVTEADIPKYYTPTVDGYTITNHYAEHREEPEKVRFLVEKIWDDENDKDGLRPESIEAAVYQNDREFDRIVLSEANSWRKEYTGLEAKDSSGTSYTYSVKELHIPDGYTSAVNGYVITNRHVPNTEPDIKRTSFTVEKIWDDANDKDGLRPKSIDVKVLRNHMAWDTITLNENNDWSHTYLDIEAEDENHNPYVYTLDEINIPSGYKAVVNGYQITNRHTPKKTTPNKKNDSPSKSSGNPDNTNTSGPSTPENRSTAATDNPQTNDPRQQASPQTGDDTQILPWFMLMLTSLMGMLLQVKKKSRRFK